jgi:hypothetical protein
LIQMTLYWLYFVTWAQTFEMTPRIVLFFSVPYVFSTYWT